MRLRSLWPLVDYGDASSGDAAAAANGGGRGRRKVFPPFVTPNGPDDVSQIVWAIFIATA